MENRRFLDDQVITPDWPAPSHIKSLSTTRGDGYSSAPFHDFNLARHVGDNPHRVAANRRYLLTKYHLPSPPQWLEQIHSTTVVEAQPYFETPPQADGIMTSENYRVCVVMTADCLPVLICDEDGEQVAAVHAGWRGLANGILEEAVSKFRAPAQNLMCWFGPAIGPQTFEVGQAVFDAFSEEDDRQQGFNRMESDGEPKWLANIYQLARLRLARIGLTACYGGDFCTVTEDKRFFSYRRDGQTGRMASLIWKTRP